MRWKVLAWLLVLAVLEFYAHPPRPLAPPVAVSHEVTRVQNLTGGTILDVTVEVTNVSLAALPDLALALLPTAPVIRRGAPLAIGALEPRQSARFALRLATPLLAPEAARLPLLFAGTCRDAGDDPRRFLARSGCRLPALPYQRQNHKPTAVPKEIL